MSRSARKTAFAAALDAQILSPLRPRLLTFYCTPSEEDAVGLNLTHERFVVVNRL